MNSAMKILQWNSESGLGARVQKTAVLCVSGCSPALKFFHMHLNMSSLNLACPGCSSVSTICWLSDIDYVQQQQPVTIEVVCSEREYWQSKDKKGRDETKVTQI